MPLFNFPWSGLTSWRKRFYYIFPHNTNKRINLDQCYSSWLIEAVMILFKLYAAVNNNVSRGHVHRQPETCRILWDLLDFETSRGKLSLWPHQRETFILHVHVIETRFGLGWLPGKPAWYTNNVPTCGCVLSRDNKYVSLHNPLGPQRRVSCRSTYDSTHCPAELAQQRAQLIFRALTMTFPLRYPWQV